MYPRAKSYVTNYFMSLLLFRFKIPCCFPLKAEVDSRFDIDSVSDY